MNRIIIVQILILISGCVVFATGQIQPYISFPDTFQMQGGTLEFAASSVNVLDSSFSENGYYQNTIRLTNYSGDPIKAIQFVLKSNGKVVMHKLAKAAGVAGWNLSTKVMRGSVLPDGSSIDSIYVILWDISRDSLTITTPIDLLTFGYDVTNISGASETTSFCMSNILGSANIYTTNPTNAGLNQNAEQIVHITKRIMRGDVNHDDKVNLIDLMMILDHITGKQLLSDQQFKNADVYPWPAGDNMVNVLDLVLLKDIILHDQYPSIITSTINQFPLTIPSSDSIKPLIRIDAKLLFSITASGIDIVLENNVPFKGLQVDLTNIAAYPNEIKPILSGTDAFLKDSILRILVFDIQGKIFLPGSHRLASLPARVLKPEKVGVQNILAVGSENQVLNIVWQVANVPGGFFQFASPVKNVLDKSYANGGYYQDTLRLVNYNGVPLKALQFSLVTHGKIQIQKISKADRLTTSDWLLSTQVVRGLLQPDGSSFDTLNVVLLGKGDAELPPSFDAMDVVTFGFNVVDIHSANFYTDLSLNNIYGAANDASDAKLNISAKQSISITNRCTWGDVNGDTRVDVLDLLMVVDHIIGKCLLPESHRKNADIYPWPANSQEPTPDGIVNVSDLVLLQKIILSGQYPDGTSLNKFVPFAPFSLSKTDTGTAVDASLIFHITNTKISIELNNSVTFKALQATFFHVPSADVGHMTSIFSNSSAQLNTDTLIVLVYGYVNEGDTLVPGHYIIAEIPVTINHPDSVSLGRVTAAGSNSQEITNTDTTITTTTVAVLAEKGKILPSYFALGQNYPNPFNPRTDISVSIPRTSHVLVTIYNMLGQEIKTLFNGQMQAGERTLQWDGRDQHGQGLASGIYVYRMVAGNFIETKKMLLLK